jgi:Cleavage inducing molecular chaperone
LCRHGRERYLAKYSPRPPKRYCAACDAEHDCDEHEVWAEPRDQRLDDCCFFFVRAGRVYDITPWAIARGLGPSVHYGQHNGHAIDDIYWCQERHPERGDGSNVHGGGATEAAGTSQSSSSGGTKRGKKGEKRR